MFLRTYLWRKPGDDDYSSPGISLIYKDLFKDLTTKPTRIIEAISLMEDSIILQYLNTKGKVKLLVLSDR
jgi:hypothetical protein